MRRLTMVLLAGSAFLVATASLGSVAQAQYGYSALRGGVHCAPRYSYVAPRVSHYGAYYSPYSPRISIGLGYSNYGYSSLPRVYSSSRIGYYSGPRYRHNSHLYSYPGHYHSYRLGHWPY